MKRRLALVLVLLGASPAAAQPDAKVVAPGGAPAAPANVETIKLALSPAAAPVPALKYHLLPEVSDVQPGNAVLLYYRAFSPEWSNLFRRPEAAKPLDKWTEDMRKVPGKELAWVRTSQALQEVDRGARRSYVDWEMIERLRKEGIAMLLPDIQSFREYGSLLAARARLETADGSFDKAVYTLQTGLKLGRDISDAPTLVQSLVGNAISTIMLQQVEELIQAPDSPNLYWALTQLPRPYIDLQKPYGGERIMLESFFPQMRNVLAGSKPRILSEAQVQAMVDRLADDMRGMNLTPSHYNWQARLGLAALAVQSYPAARRHLLATGWTAKLVETMPVLEASLLYELYNYDRLYDDFRKWGNLPYWQARDGLERAERQLRQYKAAGPSTGTVLATLLLPAVQKVQFASARTERRIAALRIIEAIRLYAVSHDGQLPQRLEDIKEVPIPIDPVTGNAFRYTVAGERAILYGPPYGREAAGVHNTLRYELTLRR
jgi:hypothetical protein